MTDCRKFSEHLEAAALESPDAPIAEELREHLSECADCRKALRECRESWLLLPAVLPRNPVSKDLETKLIEQVQASSTISLDRSNTKYSSRAVFWKYALAGSVLVALLTGSMFGLFQLGNEGVPTADSDLARIKDLAHQMDRLEQLEHAFAAPKVHFAALRSVDSNRRVQGYFVYDLIGNEGHFFGFDLVPANDRTYKLWLLGENDVVISSTMIEVNSELIGAAIVNLPEDAAMIREAVVSLEAEPFAEFPSPDVRMRSKVDLKRPDPHQ